MKISAWIGLVLLSFLIQQAQTQFNVTDTEIQLSVFAASTSTYLTKSGYSRMRPKEPQTIHLWNYQSKFFTDYQTYAKEHAGTVLDIVNGTVFVAHFYEQYMDEYNILQCKATCPTQWNFLPVQMNIQKLFDYLEIATYREYDLSGNQTLNKIPKIKWYISNIIIKRLSNENIGEYTCGCRNDRSKTSKLIVSRSYTEQLNRTAIPLINAGKLLHLNPTSEDEVLLPCGLVLTTGLPKLYVQQKDLNDTSPAKYVIVSTNSSITAVPNMGYKLNIKDLPSSQDLLWICSHLPLNSTKENKLNFNESLRMYIKWTPNSAATAADTESGRIIGLPMQGRMSCCRTNCKGTCDASTAPKMAIIPMRNEIAAVLFKPILERRKATVSRTDENFLFDEIISSPCFRNEIEYNETKVGLGLAGNELNCNQRSAFKTASETDNPEVLKPCALTHLPPSVNSGFIMTCTDPSSSGPASNRDTQEYYLALTARKTVRQGSWKLETYNASKTTGLSEVLKIGIPHPRSWPIWFSTVTNYDAMYAIRKTRIRSTSPQNSNNSSHVPNAVSMNGEFVGNEFMPAGTHLCLLCEAAEYLHSNGILWSIEFANGSRLFQRRYVLEEGMNRASYTGESTKVRPRITSVFCTKYAMGMVRVGCHAPLWNTLDGLTTVQFKTPKVLSRTAAEIHCSTAKNLTIYKGDDLKIECTITSIAAPLRIQWLLDRLLLDSFVENNIAIKPMPTFIRNDNFDADDIFLNKGNADRRDQQVRVRSEPSVTVSIIKTRLISRKCIEPEHHEDLRSCNSEPVPVKAGHYTLKVTSGNLTRVDSEAQFSVTVKETIPPRILNNITNKLSLVLGETNQEIRCESIGDPLPELSWTKDNETIPNTVQTNSGLSIVGILRFPVVGDETAGEYICQARNRFGEESEKTFEVAVAGPPNRTILVAVILSISFLIAIMILIYVFLRRQNVEKMKMIKLEKKFWEGFKGSEDQEGTDVRNDFVSLPYISEDFEIEHKDLKIGKELSRGVFGVIHLGELRRKGDPEIFTRVAIKSPISKTAESMETICSELKIIKQIQQRLQSHEHENVVNFLGAITKDFQKYKLCFVMEYCENGSLVDYMQSHLKELVLSGTDGAQYISPRTMNWAAQIAKGMTHLSDIKVVHIDLAARNVFLTKDDVAKIGDFGLSRIIGSESGYYANHYQQMTIPNKHTALEGFAKPNAKGRLSSKTDVWSYGVVVWEIYSFGKEPNYQDDVKIQNQLEAGVRLEKPRFADDQTYKMMQMCWDRNPDLRPTFPRLVTYFQLLHDQKMQQTNLAQSVGLHAEIDIDMAIIRSKSTYSTPNRKLENSVESTPSSTGLPAGIGIEMSVFMPNCSNSQPNHHVTDNNRVQPGYVKQKIVPEEV